jgi:hypothetical protein
MKDVSKYEWWAIGAIAIAVSFLSGCASVPAPTEQVAVSRNAVANALSAGAPEFAAAEMSSAQDKLGRADKAMGAKDYESARWLAEQAQVDAELAVTKTRSAKAQKAAHAVQEDGRVLREELDRKGK